MSRIYSLYLQDIVEASERIASYVKDVTHSKFETDQMRIDAVIRNLQIIGEAVKKLPDSIRDRYPNIAWQEIAGLRNRVTHVYFNVDINIIWDVVKFELPLLQTQIQQILEEISE
ncbi:DUF86 domain-containing protein [Candidatus Poribacteria bacterium]|nr:MAG: DUF86 domain-containing protein [Candidatus Poribacteria bacterium]